MALLLTPGGGAGFISLASSPMASINRGGAHFGLPPFVSQSSQKASRIVSIAISNTAKKIWATTNPMRMLNAIGNTGLQSRNGREAGALAFPGGVQLVMGGYNNCHMLPVFAYLERYVSGYLLAFE